MSEVPYYQIEDEELDNEEARENKGSEDTPYLAAIPLAFKDKKDTTGMSPSE